MTQLSVQITAAFPGAQAGDQVCPVPAGDIYGDGGFIVDQMKTLSHCAERKELIFHQRQDALLVLRVPSAQIQQSAEIGVDRRGGGDVLPVLHDIPARADGCGKETR